MTRQKETVLLTVPKYFDFIELQLTYEISSNEITVFTKSCASYVKINLLDSDIVLSDNYIDMNTGVKTVKTVYEIQ